jgi:predicted nicotinamide N-methyase
MAEDKDCRVLNLGSGAGLHAMMALRAGAHHVTAVERWLYLALASMECLSANKVGKLAADTCVSQTHGSGNTQLQVPSCLA